MAVRGQGDVVLAASAWWNACLTRVATPDPG